MSLERLILSSLELIIGRVRFDSFPSYRMNAIINPNERLIMKMELECQECDKVFSRSTKTVFPKCPRCKSEDLYPTALFGRKKDSINT